MRGFAQSDNFINEFGQKSASFIFILVRPMTTFKSWMHDLNLGRFLRPGKSKSKLNISIICYLSFSDVQFFIGEQLWFNLNYSGFVGTFKFLENIKNDPTSLCRTPVQIAPKFYEVKVFRVAVFESLIIYWFKLLIKIEKIVLLRMQFLRKVSGFPENNFSNFSSGSFSGKRSATSFRSICSSCSDEGWRVQS